MSRTTGKLVVSREGVKSSDGIHDDPPEAVDQLTAPVRSGDEVPPSQEIDTKKAPDNDRRAN